MQPDPLARDFPFPLKAPPARAKRQWALASASSTLSGLGEPQVPVGPLAPPGPVHLAGEALAPLELGLAALAWPWLAHAPAGDGHPVIVVPGLLMTDMGTLPLRTLLAARGHRVQGWGQGRNLGHWEVVQRALLPLLQQVCEQHGCKASLVGWSMGGLFVREMARRLPQHVRGVVTLGAAVAGPPRANNVWPLYQWLTGQPAETLWVEPPPVPSTSIYSRIEGMTNWRTCVQPSGPWRENVEVLSTHHGMAYHPSTVHVLADRLAQPEGGWQPFKAPQWAAPFYPDPQRPG